jgi:hypothetical protein
VARWLPSVDDFVVAKASKNLADQQISIKAKHPGFTANIFQVFLIGHFAWAQWAYLIAGHSPARHDFANIAERTYEFWRSKITLPYAKIAKERGLFKRTQFAISINRSDNRKAPKLAIGQAAEKFQHNILRFLVVKSGLGAVGGYHHRPLAICPELVNIPEPKRTSGRNTSELPCVTLDESLVVRLSCISKPVFFDGYVESTVFGENCSTAAALIVEVRQKMFALTFGYGRFILNTDFLEEKFGLKVALNCIGEGSVRSIQKRSLDQILRLSQEQASRDATPLEFGFDIE